MMNDVDINVKRKIISRECSSKEDDVLERLKYVVKNETILENKIYNKFIRCFEYQEIKDLFINKVHQQNEKIEKLVSIIVDKENKKAYFLEDMNMIYLYSKKNSKRENIWETVKKEDYIKEMTKTINIVSLENSMDNYKNFNHRYFVNKEIENKNMKEILEKVINKYYSENENTVRDNLLKLYNKVDTETLNNYCTEMGRNIDQKHEKENANLIKYFIYTYCGADYYNPIYDRSEIAHERNQNRRTNIDFVKSIVKCVIAANIITNENMNYYRENSVGKIMKSKDLEKEVEIDKALINKNSEKRDNISYGYT